MVGPLSAIQSFRHPLTFNLPWSMGNMGNSLGLPVETISYLHRRSPLRVPIHTLVEWTASLIYFLCPEKFTFGQWRIQITDLSIAVVRATTGTTPPSLPPQQQNICILIFVFCLLNLCLIFNRYERKNQNLNIKFYEANINEFINIGIVFCFLCDGLWYFILFLYR